MNLAILGTLAAGAWLAIKSQGKPAEKASPTGTTNKVNRMQHFNPDEFGQWWPDMSPELLRKLDEFRDRWGYPVKISPATGSRGRHLGKTDTSQHNIDRWREVRAVDVFPMVPGGRAGYRYLQTRTERERAYRVALRVGFTGIGLYTDTTPGNMLHVDVRKEPGVATWSRVNGNYLTIEQVLA